MRTELSEREGWCPFARPYPGTNFWPGHKGRLAVVSHIAEGSYAGTISWFRRAATSAHFLLGPDGELAQFVSVHHSAWANGLSYTAHGYVDPEGNLVTPAWQALHPGGAAWQSNPNWFTISIERAGRSGDPWTPPMRTTHARLLAWLARQFPTLAPYRRGTTFIGHCDISPIARAHCPGDQPWETLLSEANALLSPLPPPAAPTGYTAMHPLLGPAGATVDAMHLVLTTHDGGNGAYTPADVRTILTGYAETCALVGLDVAVVVAQMCHETAYLASQWAQRPRRNPAGIGVTGEKDKGVWFPSWTAAVRAHVGRLLAYALPAGQGTAAQQGLIAEALAWRALPAKLRGSVQVIRDLGAADNPRNAGVPPQKLLGWAVPGKGYGDRVAAIAERFRRAMNLQISGSPQTAS